MSFVGVRVKPFVLLEVPASITISNGRTIAKSVPAVAVPLPILTLTVTSLAKVVPPFTLAVMPTCVAPASSLIIS